MNTSIGLFVASLLCLGACNVEHYDDCNDKDPFDFDDDFETGARAGTSGKAGTPNGEDGGKSGGGGTASTAGTGGTTEPEPEPPATPCEKESECGPGFNCNLDVNECQPADAETCGELETEPECVDRSDCIPIYGGINCSCGADCECQGGEPGCICETFTYLVCQPAE